MKLSKNALFRIHDIEQKETHLRNNPNHPNYDKMNKILQSIKDAHVELLKLENIKDRLV